MALVRLCVPSRFWLSLYQKMLLVFLKFCSTIALFTSSREVVGPHDRNPVLSVCHSRHLFEKAEVVGGVELLMVPGLVAKSKGRI